MKGEFIMTKQQKESKYIKKIVELHNHIESYINENEFDKAFGLIDELGGICKTERYYVSLSTVYFNNDKLDEVKKL